MTGEFVQWMLDTFSKGESDARLAIELRPVVDTNDQRFDRRMSTLAGFVESFKSPYVGVCWDIANTLASASQPNLPSENEFRLINHVHLHDRHAGGGGLHAPLGSHGLPWQTAIAHLQPMRWSGDITLEIRYRYASEEGEPWSVLADSIHHVRSVLTTRE